MRNRGALVKDYILKYSTQTFTDVFFLIYTHKYELLYYNVDNTFNMFVLVHLGIEGSSVGYNACLRHGCS